MGSVLVGEAAQILRVSPATVREYTRRGWLKAGRDYRNYRVFAVEDVERLKRKLAKLEPESVVKSEAESSNAT